MPAAFVSSTSIDLDAAGYVIPRPTGVVSGDVLVAFGYTRASDTSPNLPPSGWAKVRADYTGSGTMFLWYRVAGSSEPTSYTFPAQASNTAVGIAAYRGVSSSAPVESTLLMVSGGTDTIVVPSVTSLRPGGVLAVGLGVRNITTNSSPPASMVERWDRPTSSSASAAWSDQALATSGATGTRTFVVINGGAFASTGVYAVILASDNSAPNAPILVSPANNETINRDNVNRFSWVVSDPDVGDGQSQADLRFRFLGSPTWTWSPSVSGPNPFYDYPAGGLGAGSYEWQVRTYDNDGLVGPWSGSGFFSAASPPPGPSITAPTNGSTIALNTATVTWSTSVQQSYQVRVVADSGGGADTSSVLHDTGEMVSTSVRSVTVPFPTNSVYRHVQVRVKDAGLFSPWSSVRVLVSYIAPAVPSVALSAVKTITSSESFTDAISVNMTNGTRVGSQPVVTYLNVWCRANTDGDAYRPKDIPVRIATQRPAGAYLDRSVASGVDYSYAAEAVGSNGTSVLSAFTASSVVAPPPVEGASTYGSGAYGEGIYG